MTSRYNRHVTIYSDYIEGQITQIARRGGGHFTFKEIASGMGLKPTHNLRKRLRTLEQHGALTISYGQTEACAWCLIYSIPNYTPPSADLSDIPF